MQEVYVDTLIEDLKHDLLKVEQKELIGIFIGGGTPTLLSSHLIAKLLGEINKLISFRRNIEITIEANPGTVTKSQLSNLRTIGINRLSIGIQSFQNDKLKILGRIHNKAEAINVVNMAQEVGFDNINIDLMFGLPGQTIVDAIADIKNVLALNSTHFSWYQLTIEPNTVFYQQRLNMPNDDVIAEMQQQGQQLLAEHKFKQYEISAYSKQNWRCRHNINYWQFGDYLGIGAGAHGKITTSKNSAVSRISKFVKPEDYLNSNLDFVYEHRDLACKELIAEFMLNALRLYEPVPVKLFIERTGLVLEDIMHVLKQASEYGFIEWNNDNIVTTEFGKRYLNRLLELFI